MENKVFEHSRIKSPGYSAFDLSFEHKLSCQMGELIPTCLQEIVPGDMFRVNTEMMLRLAPTLYPIMHRVNAYIHYFFVPNRLVWDDWEDFITGGDSGAVSNPTFPQLTGTTTANFAIGRLPDYFGIASGNSAVTAYDFISQLPFRAYHLIWSEYYRDQYAQTEFDPNAANTDGVLTELRDRCWEKDYFTSSLPEAVRGGDTLISGTVSSLVNYKAAGTDGIFTGATSGAVTSSGAGNAHPETPTNNNIAIENISSIANTLSLSVNDLRLAVRTQEFWETAMRVGNRYIEAILGHFGVVSSNRALQRPQYLGGGKQPLVISEVVNTSGAGSDPQGTMVGHGISVGSSFGFQEQFEEHGYVMGILSVLPRTAYQQGVPKTFIRDDRFDFYWPEFAHLGEQVVENRELYFNAGTAGDDPTGTFGYQQRYAEYKYNPSIVSGEFRTSLDAFHMARQFSSEPDLNEAFLVADISPIATEDGGITQRIYANTTEDDDKLWIQLYHDVKAKRPMPYFGDPRL